jgi:hypothetical protein
LATVLPGAVPFKEGNVNDTFRGQILLAGGDVKSAVLKDLESKQLCNELLGSTLAKATGLPTPDAFLAVVRAGDLSVAKGPVLPDGNRIVFASADVKVPNVTHRLTKAPATDPHISLKDLIEWDRLGELYAFDAWVANVDRHPGNLLLGQKDEVWLIDHGYCFSGPNWQPEELNPDASYRNRLGEWLTCWLTPGEKCQRSAEATAFAEPISRIDISVSSEASRIEEFIAPRDATAAADFLSLRIAIVPREASRALDVPRLV